MITDRNIGLKIYLDKLARAAGVRPEARIQRSEVRDQRSGTRISASAPPHQTTAAHAGDAIAEAAVSKLPASSSPNGAGQLPERA